MRTRNHFIKLANIIASAEPDTIEGYTPEELLRIARAIDRSPFRKLLPDELTPDERSFAAEWAVLSGDCLARLEGDNYPRKP